MEIDTQITLDHFEQKICQAIAKLRHKNNRTKGVRNAKVGDQSDWETDLEGFAAEMAFCKGFNVYPDFSIQTRSSQKGEDDGDATLREGLSVDIKSTKYPDGQLLAVTWKEPKVDLFALMVGTFPTYVFKGFLRKEQLLRKDHIRDLGHGETYAAGQGELLSLEEILNPPKYFDEGEEDDEEPDVFGILESL